MRDSGSDSDGRGGRPSGLVMVRCVHQLFDGLPERRPRAGEQ
ncbi:hypothetical protein Taro_048925 [Colocasia esculenta]|uniref:Uncharacterized protein n=1 Tax=Colocasia esculenta TaxID=4460 RepID=A0A843X9H7_COLES|nr:hypothetical protein [Colocasia esculenta]